MRSPSVWIMGAVTTRALGSVLQKPYQINSTTPAIITPPYASGSTVSVRPSSEPCEISTNSSVSITTSIVPYPTASPTNSSLPTLPATLVSASSHYLLSVQSLASTPTQSSPTSASSATESAKSLRVANKAVVPVASYTIDLPLLSSILIPGPPQQSTKTWTVATSATVSLTLPTSLSTSLSGLVSSALATTATSIPTTFSIPSGASTTEIPVSPPFSYNPSASRGSATSISRPIPEPSSANVVGSTLSASSPPSSTGDIEIPPAPSAAGAPGGLGARGKERVWWVVFFIPFLLGA